MIQSLPVTGEGKFLNFNARPPGNADRTFRDQFSSRNSEERGGAFSRRDHDQKSGWGSGGNAFGKREANSTYASSRSEEGIRSQAPAPSKPKSNPFGNAAPRDEMEVQRKIEEGRKAREALENERKEQARLSEKVKIGQEKSKVLLKEDSIPTGQGSWRRASTSKPIKSKVFERAPKPNEKKDEAGVSLKKGGHKDDKTAASTADSGKNPKNAYSLLEQVSKV